MRIQTRWVGQSVLCLNRTDSTNRVAHDIASKNAQSGTVVFAETQSQGRGRLGRQWSSPSGGLYFSVLLRPKLNIEELPKITLQTAESVCRVLNKHYQIDAKTKWPNDVWVGGKKICGILTETRAEADRVFYVVIGIGINVNSLLKSLPSQATSMKRCLKRKVNRSVLAVRVLSELEARIDALNYSSSRRIHEQWRKSSLLLGKKVRVKTLRGMLAGKAMDIDKDGALVIDSPVEGRKRILSGDVLLCRN